MLEVAEFFGNNKDIYAEAEIYQTMLTKIVAAMLNIAADSRIAETESGDCNCNSEEPVTEGEKDIPVSLDLPKININDTIARIQSELTRDPLVKESSCLMS